METHSSILAWRIIWTEEPGGLQSMASQRVGHDLANLITTVVNQILSPASELALFQVCRLDTVCMSVLP